MSPDALRDKHAKPLQNAAAHLQAHRSDVEAHREELVKRARVQRDSINDVIHDTEAAVEAHPENPLLQLRLNTLIRERATLDRILHRYKDETDAG